MERDETWEYFLAWLDMRCGITTEEIGDDEVAFYFEEFLAELKEHC